MHGNTNSNAAMGQDGKETSTRGKQIHQHQFVKSYTVAAGNNHQTTRKSPLLQQKPRAHPEDREKSPQTQVEVASKHLPQPKPMTERAVATTTTHTHCLECIKTIKWHSGAIAHRRHDQTGRDNVATNHQIPKASKTTTTPTPNPQTPDHSINTTH
jgi:hypothetical protein